MQAQQPTQKQTLSVLYTDESTGSVEERLVEIDSYALTGSGGTSIMEARATNQNISNPIPIGGNYPDFDIEEFEDHVGAMLAADGVPCERNSILQAYGLVDPLPVPFTYRGSLIEADTSNETIDIIVFAREDMVLPVSIPGLEVDILSLGTTGLSDPGPIAVRLTGEMSAFVQQSHGLFPIGTVVDYDNLYGSWQMSAIADQGGEYSLELRLGGMVVQTW